MTDCAAREDLARELARLDDWRQAVEDLKLPESAARALRIAVIRLRNFGAVQRFRPRPRRRA